MIFAFEDLSNFHLFLVTKLVGHTRSQCLGSPAFLQRAIRNRLCLTMLLSLYRFFKYFMQGNRNYAIDLYSQILVTTISHNSASCNRLSLKSGYCRMTIVPILCSELYSVFVNDAINIYFVEKYYLLFLLFVREYNNQLQVFFNLSRQTCFR